MLAAIAEEAALRDRDARFPTAAMARLHRAGVLALTVPIGLGGGSAGLAIAAGAVRQVGQACPATALILAMQLGKHAALARDEAVPAALRERIGAEAVSEGALINALRVEPELGSPTRGGLPATTAWRTEGGWRLSGHKRYVTGSTGLRWMDVLARTDEDPPRLGRFFVTAETRGITIRETWNHLGLRASGSHDVIFKDVFIPDDQAVGLAPAPLFRGNDAEQAIWNALLIGAVYSGVAHAARRWIIGFLRTRKPTGLGAPLATLDGVQEKVGAIEGLLSVNARVTEAMAAATDAGRTPAASEAALAKVTLAENAIRAVEIAVSLAGNHGHDRAHPLERHWRDVQCARVHVPNEDSARRLAGRQALQQEGVP
ncbi:acyl-CoA/acyl-ACP dehydrogenase [Roseomonas arctica]|uniref:Acyl-CoA/acyl-ACP dehydrogenase n=2 Tax=Plastoroseomonas arctica TaxID=1509237 RepID=A0AAF1JV31_9PROT|nr:acyl-CoA/acyl-ACP dehydrogenase [Plastoroseomonas arctica]